MKRKHLALISNMVTKDPTKSATAMRTSTSVNPLWRIFIVLMTAAREQLQCPNRANATRLRCREKRYSLPNAHDNRLGTRIVQHGSEVNDMPQGRRSRWN